MSDGTWTIPERTACKTVAANMRRLRKEHGWTQEELGERLGGWSAVALSAAERSIDGKRVRVFDIDEVVQLAGLFGVGVTDLITPIPPCSNCGGAPPPGMQCLACGATTAPVEGNGETEQ